VFQYFLSQSLNAYIGVKGQFSRSECYRAATNQSRRYRRWTVCISRYCSVQFVGSRSP